MKTLTVRMKDEDYAELTAIAAARGMTLSDLARDTLGGLIRPGLEARGRLGGDVPDHLDVVTRRQLALLHRILARLVDDEHQIEDGDRDYQLHKAKVLEQGYVVDYVDEFQEIEPELSRQESAWVMDLLEMFERLELSYAALTHAERARFGSNGEYGVQFAGFDFNDRREGRLHGYAKYLIDDGRWGALAKYFHRDHDGGNSHRPMFDTYDRMLEEFSPIWKEKVRVGGRTLGRSGYDLDADQLGRVLDARVHPSNR